MAAPPWLVWPACWPACACRCLGLPACRLARRPRCLWGGRGPRQGGGSDVHMCLTPSSQPFGSRSLRTPRPSTIATSKDKVRDGRSTGACTDRPTIPRKHHTAVAWVRAGGRGPPPIWGQWDPENPLGRRWGGGGQWGPPEGSGSRPGPLSTPPSGSRPGGRWCNLGPPLLAAGWGRAVGRRSHVQAPLVPVGGARQWDGHSPQGKVKKLRVLF